MSAVQPLPTVRPTEPMVVLVKGRIEASRLFDGRRYTRVIAPAPDAYSRPSFVEIQSKSKLGEKDEEVTQLCRLGGFTRKAFRATDRDSGETTMVTPVDNTLEAIE